MRESGRLEGRKIAILAADGFEKIEVSAPLKALKREGATVDIVSLRHGRIRGVNLHEPAGKLRVNRTVEEADPREYDGLMIPGGFINPDLLRQSAAAREFVQAFDEADKPIATLCHGPWVLISAGLAEGRTMTSWPGIRDDVVNSGATWVDEEVVRDGNVLSSRGPQDLKPFMEAMVSLFEAGYVEHAAAVPAARGISDPQRVEAPPPVLKTMKWMPRPSFRTALGVGAVAAAAGALAWRRIQQLKQRPDTLVVVEEHTHADYAPVI